MWSIVPVTMEINRNLLTVEARRNTGLLWTITSRTQQGNSSSLQLYMIVETSEIRNHLKSSRLKWNYSGSADSRNTPSVTVICTAHLCLGAWSCAWMETLSSCTCPRYTPAFAGAMREIVPYICHFIWHTTQSHLLHWSKNAMVDLMGYFYL